MRLGVRAAAAALLLVCLAGAQEFYQFTVDEDALAGGPLDFGYLNKPLTPADRIFVRGEHFYKVGPDLTPNTTDDERVRFFGTNITFSANTPHPDDAPRIAKRLRRLGINIVRLHHMDYYWGGALAEADGFLTGNAYPDLNTNSVARLRKLLDAFKAEGIYIDWNVKVTHTFRPILEGLPNTPQPDGGKPLNIFYPRMVELQQEYVRRMIDGLDLREDPVLAMIEFNNENSMLHMWQSEWENQERWIVGEYRAELDRQWNNFLRARYGTTDNVRAAWGETTQDGPNFLTGAWDRELHGSSAATLSESAGTLTVRVTNGSNWVIVKKTGFSLQPGTTYVAEIDMRADTSATGSKPVYWSVMRNTSPWDTMGSTNISVTNQWQTFRFVFTAKSAVEGVGRFHLGVERVDVPLYIRNAAIRVAGQRGLPAGQSLEANNIATLLRSDTASAALTKDYLLFLTEVDRAYLAAMKRAAQERLSSLVPLTGTQVGFGGALNYDSHREMDWIDEHFYVDHYSFPGTPWDARNWNQSEQSGVREGMWHLWGLAARREAGKPYTVSEMNQPWPNSYRAELLPEISAFAAFQDWDALYQFNYRGDRKWDERFMNSFNLAGDWSQYATTSQAAWMFRTGAVSTGTGRVTIPLTEAQRLQSGVHRYEGDVARFMADTFGYNRSLPLARPVAIVREDFGTVPEAVRTPESGVYRSSTSELTFANDARRMLIHSARAAGVIGMAAPREKVTAGSLEIEPAPGARGFVTALLTARDDQPLATSGSMLLSIPGQSLRSMPGVTPARPQRVVRYAGTDKWTAEPDRAGYLSGSLWEGASPTWMERVESYVTVKTLAREMVVYPLDQRGQRLGALSAVDVERVQGGFRIHVHREGAVWSPWYEIVASNFPEQAAMTNGASFARGAQARDSIVTAWGSNMGNTPAITVRDMAGTERQAFLFYGSPNQVNFHIPADTVPGLATVTIRAEDGATATATMQVNPVAPGLFAAGDRLAAAEYIRVRADGTQSKEPVLRSVAGGGLELVPVDLGPAGDRVYLTLYATGVRYRSGLENVRVLLNGVAAPAEYAGAQGSFIGLDQINVVLPRTLTGEVQVQVGLDGLESNTVRIAVR